MRHSDCDSGVWRSRSIGSGQAELPWEELTVVVDECHEADVGRDETGGQARQPIHRRVRDVAEAGEGDRLQPTVLLLVAFAHRLVAHRPRALLGVVWNVIAKRFHMLITAIAPTR